MKSIAVLFCLPVAVALSIMGAGCEVDSAESSSQAEVLISPNYASLARGQAAEFTASGWYEYNWSLAYPDWGTLSHKTGKTTVYTAISNTNATQILTCSATVPTGSNSTSTVTAEALIEHR